MHFGRIFAACVLLVAMSTAVAACGGGGSSSSTTSESAGGAKEPSSEKAAAPGGESAGGTTELAKAPSEVPPTTLPAGLEPLPKAPKKGINVVTLQCDLPTCAGYTKVFESIASKLGWKNRTIVFKNGSPQEAMTQAVNIPGVEYINTSGVTTSVIKPQLKIAAEKGIKVMKGEDPGPIEPPTVPVSISNAVGNTEHPAEEITRWMINDSEGKANIVVINYPEVPISGVAPGAVSRVVEAECPECGVEELAVSGEELAGGQVPAKVVAYLQSHPETNYVLAGFGNLSLGVPQALKTAGLAEKVKLVGMSGIEASELAALAKEEIKAYYVSAQGEFATGWADAIARESEGLPLPQKAYESLPQGWLCKPETAEECKEWELFPASMQEKWEELWHVE